LNDDWILRAGDLEVGLKPSIGGAITHFAELTPTGAIDFMRRARPGFTDVLETASFPLAPFCNRVRDGLFTFRGRTVHLSPNLPPQKHPLHGQAWRGAWTMVEASHTAAEMVYLHQPGEWPWAYQARQWISLDASGLSMRLTCRNLSADDMPCALGFHPFYPCNGQTILDTGVDGVLTVDDEVMPIERVAATGRYALGNRAICGVDLDNGYDGWSGEATLTWPDAGRALTLTSHAPYFQVYAPPGGALLAAEPVMNANGALNAPEDQWSALGMSILAPGEATEITARFTVSKLGG
jgi:aldose 1-epimerase